ncbi:MerR family DNA-binding transcriptional regulator [Streptomyces chiangmaiensis]|uniref:MerR family DNA-binding transcriptional regulator n=1 Tax=Streptomyces chiangmaiensis TaxID=766497 RepID=UPI003CD09D07
MGPRTICGVSTRTLRRYILEGVLEDRRSPGGRRIFRIGDLDALSRWPCVLFGWRVAS